MFRLADPGDLGEAVCAYLLTKLVLEIDARITDMSCHDLEGLGHVEVVVVFPSEEWGRDEVEIHGLSWISGAGQ